MNECTIPYMANKAISMFFQSKGLPALTNHSLPYFMLPSEIRKPSQWLHLFGEISRLALFIHNEPRFPLFSPLVFYHKLLVVITECIQIRQYGIGNFEHLSEFRDFFVSHIDNYYWLWYPRNRTHLRN